MKTTLTAALGKLRDDLGPVGMASLALFAAALAFLFLSLKPLEARNSLLETELARAEQRGHAGGAGAAGSTAERMADFYAFFEQSKPPQDGQSGADWLAKLHALAKDSGVELRSATYQMSPMNQGAATGAPASIPLERYEISLPLNGSYAQIRGFLEKALAEIPVLSLDQVSFHRKTATDTVIQADVRLSLHKVKQ